ncbi:hypothetical protein DLAC_09391 [Tieghemostelium lacteum]|uniref:Uncharacterized protein n=1 Tax=Tieghemostelium lacteum TaxID=361077 RepID=A0A151Z9Z1_TIELA|nr:hypothetical protein DLAC_09391 [Tieghemostelium lacteum]|eukprot:KYQ90753.1 hypothetical protein DLAC_09391 [Tieghemostelium lacteum]
MKEYVITMIKNKVFLNLRFQIVVLTIIGWAIAMSIDRTLVDKYRVRADAIYADIPHLNELVRSTGDKVALILLSVFETGLFGLGIGFFIAVGMKVFNIKNKNLRRRMIRCWACISFFMVAWWPHSTSHSLVMVSDGDPVDNTIAIECSFHWTIMVCSLTLSYFQYDLIMLMFEVAMMKRKLKERKEVNPLKMEWYRNFKYHALVIVALFFSAGMIIMFHYEPLSSSYHTYQNVFLVTFKIVDSTVMAFGMGFAYIAIRVVILLEFNNKGYSIGNFKKVLIVSSFCIWFLFVIQYAHPMVHGHTPVAMKSTISIDFGIHIPMIIATSVLAYYQFKLLELATDSRSAISIAMRIKNNNSHNLSIPGKSITIKTYGGDTQHNDQEIEDSNPSDADIELGTSTTPSKENSSNISTDNNIQSTTTTTNTTTLQRNNINQKINEPVNITIENVSLDLIHSYHSYDEE